MTETANKVTLVIVPNFNHDAVYRPSGDYLIVLPQGPTILWKMFCTSSSWAIADTIKDCAEDLNNAFGENHWQIDYYENATRNPRILRKYIAGINAKNPQVDLKKVQNYFHKTKMPPWER